MEFREQLPTTEVTEIATRRNGDDTASTSQRLSDPTAWPFALLWPQDKQRTSSANNQGTADDARATGLDGGLVTDAMDRAFEAQGRVAEDEAVRA